MCGLFGFIGPKVDVGVLSQLAVLADTRGPHAFGIAYGADTLRAIKHVGSIINYGRILEFAKDAQVVLGHCRLSTSGVPEDNRNNQPIVMNGIWLAHNGNIHSHTYPLTTECDSEALLWAIEENGLVAALDWAAAQAPVAASVFRDKHVYLYRDRHPLYSDGTYWCSRYFNGAQMLTERVCVELTV